MARVDSLAINGVVLLSPGLQFNFPCPGNPLVVSIRVRVHEKTAEVVECAIGWDNELSKWPESKMECTTRNVDIDPKHNLP